MDKNKLIQSATKFVQKGQFDKAIKEYQRVLEEDPKDIRILLKIGELHQKRGDNVQAAQNLLKVAESYSSDGFFLKAAAVYKQVLKLNPSLIDINFKLAELYQQLGLMSDALQQYQTVATAYEQQGDAKASLAIIKKLIELDPENAANRIRLAESYAREGMNAEAIEEFKKVAEALKQNSRADEYVKVAERLAFLDPQNMDLCRELANVYLAKGDTKRALAKLQICFKSDPRDIETLTLLAQAFRDLGQTAKTISVYKELAKLHSENDRLDDERNVWKKILNLAPDDPEAQRWRTEDARPAPAAPPPARVRSSPSATMPAARPADALGPEAVPRLLTETDVYLKYGLHAKAADHLKKILALAPSSLPAHEKAKDLYLAVGDKRRGADELVLCANLALEAGEGDRAREHFDRLQEIAPDHPELPRLGEALGSAVEAAEVADDAILVEATDDEILVAADDDSVDAEAMLVEDPASSADESLYVDPESGEAPPLEIDAIEGDEALLFSDPVADEDEPILADEDSPVDEASGAPMEAEELVEEEAPASSIELGELEIERLPEDDGAAAGLAEEPSVEMTLEGDLLASESAEDGEELHEATAVSTLPAVEEEDQGTQTFDREALMAQALYEAPARAGPAAPSIRRPPAPLPFDDEPDAGDATRIVMLPLEIPEPPRSTPAPARPAPRPSPAPAVIAPPPVEEEEPEELSELEFFIEQELWDEAAEVLEGLRSRVEKLPAARLRFEDLERRLLAATASAAPAEPEAEERFNLAAELAKEVAEAPAPPAAEDFQYPVEDTLREFKKGIERLVRPEDVETHYDLGIAYKEMGLIDEAIGEFETAAKGAAGKPREADCLAMIGVCHGAKGNVADAIAIFERALGVVGLRSETRTNLFYEIGVGHEELGEVAAAREAYEKVAALDVKYRDVEARLAKLGPPAGKVRKIGYL